MAAAPVPLPCHQSPVPAPHTLPCAGGQQGGSGGTCPARCHPASRTSDSQHGGLCCTALPGENSFFVPSRPSISPLKHRAGQQALSCVSCRVALQIDRAGTALQLPAPPYLESDTVPWASIAAGRAVAHGGLLWHLGGPHTGSVVPAWGTVRPPLTLWGTRPQGRAAFKC